MLVQSPPGIVLTARRWSPAIPWSGWQWRLKERRSAAAAGKSARIGLVRAKVEAERGEPDMPLPASLTKTLKGVTTS